MLRHNVGPRGEPDEVLLNLWAGIVDTDGIIVLTFDNCMDHGISPEALVGDDYGPTQVLAEGFRARGSPGLIAPSAALPGTEILVLFGPRVWHPFLVPTITPEECATAHLTDAARPPAEVASFVRWFGAAHSALDGWRATGRYPTFVDTLATRW
jgi:hypothetical protein